jgi:hypothetical protein
MITNGLLLDDYRNSAYDHRPYGSPFNVSSDRGLPDRQSDDLCVPDAGSAGREFVQYFYFIPYDGKGTPTDKLRRNYKAIAQSRRCPGCNWLPKWKSCFGPYPLYEGDVVWCSKKCKERTLK